MTKLMSTGYAGVRLWNKEVCIILLILPIVNLFIKTNYKIVLITFLNFLLKSG